MEKQNLWNVLEFYYETAKLKEVERSGWKRWNVSRDKRIESIPEHVYGTQQLAIAIYSEYKLRVDISKVLMMLAIHETEEINIGDITPFDGVTAEEKLAMGKEAVEKTFRNLAKKKFFIDLIDEFNAKKTPEAIFAHLCDKMEADLQVKKYSDEGRCSLDNASAKIMKDPDVQRIVENGATTVADVFIEYDAPKYEKSKIFSEMIQFLKTYQTKIVPKRSFFVLKLYDEEVYFADTQFGATNNPMWADKFETYEEANNERKYLKYPEGWEVKEVLISVV